MEQIVVDPQPRKPPLALLKVYMQCVPPVSQSTSPPATTVHVATVTVYEVNPSEEHPSELSSES